MRTTTGRRLDAIAATLERLHDMTDLFEPGRGTALPHPDHPGPARFPAHGQGRLPLREARRPVQRREVHPRLQAVRRLDELFLLWQALRELDAEGEEARERIAAALASRPVGDTSQAVLEEAAPFFGRHATISDLIRTVLVRRDAART